MASHSAPTAPVSHATATPVSQATETKSPSKIAPSDVIDAFGSTADYLGRGLAANILTGGPQRNLPNFISNADAILVKGKEGLKFANTAASSRVMNTLGTTGKVFQGAAAFMEIGKAASEGWNSAQGNDTEKLGEASKSILKADLTGLSTLVVGDLTGSATAWGIGAFAAAAGIAVSPFVVSGAALVAAVGVGYALKPEIQTLFGTIVDHIVPSNHAGGG